MDRLAPDHGPTSVEQELGAYRPWQDPPAGRPYVALNFAATVDGRSSIDGRSGPIGSDVDTAMLVGLRQRFDAVMIGAGTMRVEQYGRIIDDPEKRARRESLGLPGDPLMVIVGGLDLPWDAGLFTDGGGKVILFTADEGEPPETATPVEVIREPGGRVDMATAMTHLRAEHDVRAVLCEGGPRLHSQLAGRWPRRRALPDDRAEIGRRRRHDPRGRPARGRPARAGVVAPGRLGALRPLQAAMN